MPKISYVGTLVETPYPGNSTCSEGSPITNQLLNFDTDQITEWNPPSIPQNFPTTIEEFLSQPDLYTLTFTLNIQLSAQQEAYPKDGEPGTIDICIVNSDTNHYVSYYQVTSSDCNSSDTCTYNVNQIYSICGLNYYNIPPCFAYCSGTGTDDCCGSDNCYVYDVSMLNACVNGSDATPWENLSVYPTQIYPVIYNYCGGSFNCNDQVAPSEGGCNCHPSTNFTVTLTLSVNVTINCTESNLENPICSNYCNVNLDSCLSDMVAYCFENSSNVEAKAESKMPANDNITRRGSSGSKSSIVPANDNITQRGSSRTRSKSRNPTNPTNPVNSVKDASSASMPIADSASYCRTFIPNYINAYGPQAEFDTGLDGYCSIYPSFNSLLDANDSEQDVCACHLSQSLYTNLEASINQAFPNFDTTGFAAECLFGQCASVGYKSIDTGKQCAVPQCLNISSFNINGSVDQSNINVNQNSTCTNLVSGQGQPGPPGSSGSPGSSSTSGFFSNKFVLIGTILLIVLIIIAIIAMVYIYL